MIVIENLKRVKIVHNRGRMGGGDGIYKRNKDYFITFLHGNEDGKISLQVNDWFHEIDVKYIRQFIKEMLGVIIPDTATLYITPCYPLEVAQKLKDELVENNIKVVGDWSDETNWCIFEEETCFPYEILSGTLRAGILSLLLTANLSICVSTLRKIHNGEIPVKHV